MNENDLQPLRTVYHRKLAETKLDFKRYLYSQINWDVGIALKALQKRDFVHEFNGKIIVYDRFFAIWLRRETAGI